MKKLDENGYTTIGKDPGAFDYLAIAFIGVLFFAGFAIIIPTSNQKAQEQRLNSDCSQFRDQRITEVPARCVTPEGGFSVKSGGLDE